jgi:hypothetical protein
MTLNAPAMADKQVALTSRAVKCICGGESTKAAVRGRSDREPRVHSKQITHAGEEKGRKREREERYDGRTSDLMGCHSTERSVVDERREIGTEEWRLENAGWEVDLVVGWGEVRVHLYTGQHCGKRIHSSAR